MATVALGGMGFVILVARLVASLLRDGGLPGLGQSRGLVAREGHPAPDFTLELFDGGNFRLSEQHGKAVVLNFWASWCAPCREEMPAFEQTYRAYRDRGVVFVGVAVRDDPAAARALLKELGITYPAGLEEGNAITVPYRLVGMPTTVFIGRDGRLVRKRTGALSED